MAEPEGMEANLPVPCAGEQRRHDTRPWGRWSAQDLGGEPSGPFLPGSVCGHLRARAPYSALNMILTLTKVSVYPK
jgi:hypothetical protein